MTAPSPNGVLTDAAQQWRDWRRDALERLRLEDVYGPWLTGGRQAEGWLEARDSASPTGDRDPSAGVADGTNEYERGTFHSFRDQRHISVFDFLVEQGR